MGLAVRGFLGLVLMFLYLPLLAPFSAALSDVDGHWSLAPLAAMAADPSLRSAIGNSLIIAVAVGLITPLLALACAQAVRTLAIQRSILVVVLLPLFVPGVSLGVALAVSFQVFGVIPSLATMVTAQVLWALPFAFLIVLTSMASFDTVLLEAAHTCGANRWQAFIEVELPLIRQGLGGAALFSVILSCNETIRTALVQGGNNTVATLIWSRYQQVGLGPELHALMALIIFLTLGLITALAVLETRQG